MRILHAIHDFLPRHAAGSEIYAFQLCRELAKRHVVHVLAAEYDPARPHGSLTWRVHDGLPVIELVNNWEGSFANSWRSLRLGAQLAHVLRATQPDVLHVHSLLNLSFELPALARAQGTAVAATMHDHSLACPAGGQRLHIVEQTVCDEILPDRCAACFSRSPFHSQMAVGSVSRAVGRGGTWIGRAAKQAARLAPGAAALFSRRVLSRAQPVTGAEVSARLDGMRRVFDAVQVFVSPSEAVANAHAAAGLDRAKLVVSDYGFARRQALPADGAVRSGRAPGSPLRIGFAGTLVRHKGAHVLVEAARLLPAGRFEVELWGSLDTFPGYVADLRSLARGLPARFCGSFDNNDAAAIYGRFDVLVVPSLWPENSPLVIHEAFMAGVPVVAARMGGIPELITDGVNGLLYRADDAAALAAALGALIDDRARLARMASHALPVKSIEDDAMEWEGRYEKLLSRPSHGYPTRLSPAAHLQRR